VPRARALRRSLALPAELSHRLPSTKKFETTKCIESVRPPGKTRKEIQSIASSRLPHDNSVCMCFLEETSVHGTACSMVTEYWFSKISDQVGNLLSADRMRVHRNECAHFNLQWCPTYIFNTQAGSKSSQTQSAETRKSRGKSDTLHTSSTKIRIKQCFKTTNIFQSSFCWLSSKRDAWHTCFELRQPVNRSTSPKRAGLAASCADLRNQLLLLHRGCTDGCSSCGICCRTTLTAA